MSKQLRLDVAQLTDVGRKRPHNEDNMAYVIPKDEAVMARKGALFIVADGMGGHAAGEVASEIAVDTVTNVYYQEDSDDIPISLMNAIRRANSLIHQRAAENMLRSGMGTTCVAAVLRGNIAYIANVGDSRAYIVRRSMSKQISQDHSWVEEQVRAGLLTKEQARSHAQRNVITRSLGTQPETEVDIFSEELEEGDALILCTDGLSGSTNEDDLRVIVDKYPPQESVYYLVERANENGGPDNITAIVVRVLEVGLEPPGMRRPVHVGAPVADEDTAIIGRVPSSKLSMTTRPENGRIPTGVLRPGTGPLFLQPSPPSQPLPELASRKKRNRFLYPTLIILLLLLIAGVGLGAYDYLHLPINVDGYLSDANTQINQASQEKMHNPTDALQKLALAQKDLTAVASISLSSQQIGTLSDLQNKLTTMVKTTLTTYNQQGLIANLPCGNMVTNVVTNGSVNTQPSMIATIQSDKTSITYILGDDHNLYQLNDQHSLTNQYLLVDKGDQVLTMTSNTHFIFILTKSPALNTTSLPTYKMHVLESDPDPAQSHKLKETNVILIDVGLVQAGWVPKLMAATGSDAYVFLTSPKQPNQALIQNYKTDKLVDPPQSQHVSISLDLLSVAAFPANQLFMLFNNGSLQSLMFSPENGTQPVGQVPTAPQVVRVQHFPIATPLAVNGKDFTWSTPLATPVALQSPQFLSVPGATTPGSAFLVAGSVNGSSHLYIADNTSHRIMDLVVAPEDAAVTPTPTTAATPATNGPGGKVLDSSNPSVVLQLVRQYASTDVLPLVKGVVIDPSGMQVNLLIQAGKMYNQISVDVATMSACVPGS